MWTALALERGRRFRHHPYGARVPRQVPARRRKNSPRDRAERKPGRLVQGLPVRVRFGRRHAALHHRDERLREESGDLEFVRGKWDSLWRAYQFLHSTTIRRDFPQNFGIGHGWVEGGPLLPVRGELYQSGVGAAALHGLANVAHLAWQEDEGPSAQDRGIREARSTRSSGSPTKSATPSRWIRRASRSTNPACSPPSPCGLACCDEDQARPMINELAAPEHQADWGMRIIARTASRTAAAAIITVRCGRCSPDGLRSANINIIATPGVRESARECPARPRRLARARHRGFFGRSIPAALDEFAAPDLVRGDGDQPAAARDVRVSRTQ